MTAGFQPKQAALREEFLGLQAGDRAVRRELIEAGQLYGRPHLPKDWYHPRMARSTAATTPACARSWPSTAGPGRALAGEDGAEAAWFIAQHAVLDLDLQRRALALLEAAAATGDARPAHMAMLTDRVRMAEGRPQVYGCIHVGNEQGELVPAPPLFAPCSGPTCSIK